MALIVYLIYLTVFFAQIHSLRESLKQGLGF